MPACEFYVVLYTRKTKHQTRKDTRAPTHTKSQTPLRQLYLFSLSPWKCTRDQTKARWTACAFSTFLLPGQSNNIRPRWCSKVGHGPRSLSRLRRCAQRRGGGGGQPQAHGHWSEIWSQNHEPLWLQYNTFIIDSDKVCAISNVASVLLIISDPREQAVCFFFTVQREAGSCDEIHADSDKNKSHLNSWDTKELGAYQLRSYQQAKYDLETEPQLLFATLFEPLKQ